MKPEITVEVAVVCRAFNPGDVVILIPNRRLTMEESKRTGADMKLVTQETGIKFVLLPDNWSLGTREVRTETETKFEGTNEVHHPSEVDDAARYRWLRQNWGGISTIDATGPRGRRVSKIEPLLSQETIDPVSLDEAIDEARDA
jgi:hypothetical protein